MDTSRLQGLANLHDINLKYNSFLSGYFTLPQLSSLRTLNVFANNISSIDADIFKPQTMLSLFYAQRNPYLRALPDCTDIPTLVNVEVYECSIEYMPLLYNLPALSILDLRDNIMTEHAIIQLLPAVTIIVLAHIKLTTFTVNVTNAEDEPALPLLD